MSLKQQANTGNQIDEKLVALMTNANAIRAIAAAVEGTIGPKGLDTMLVDRFGDVIITNDGVTILTMMEANHPAARMLINVAKAQQAEIGDGTTTATIMAGALVSEGVNQVVKGVPVARVIDGIRTGVSKGIEVIGERARPISSLEDQLLEKVALVAGREHKDIAELVVKAAELIGVHTLHERPFKLSDTIVALEGAENQVFMGVLINKEPVNDLMPKHLNQPLALIIDDALEPEELSSEALATEAGFMKYSQLRQEFEENLHKIVAAGVKLVLVDRGLDDRAEDFLTDAGVMVLQRVANKELRKAAEHLGARPIKRSGLKKTVEELHKYLGKAEQVLVDEKLEHVQIYGGKGKAMATVLVGAATQEVVGERERIAKDAAASVQAAIKGGIVPGGGSIELFAAREVERERENVRGMAAYGVDCVVAALKKPLSQIVENAGFNPLEKVGDVVAAQAEQHLDSLALDCENGQIEDMWAIGVVDPALVKIHALKAAGEIAEAILRIDTIIKKKEEKHTKENDFGEVV